MNMQSPSPVLARQNEGPIAVLTLTRPETRNTLSEALLAALGAELTAIGGDKAIRAVVLNAEGPVFSAGHDMKEMTARRTDKDGGRAYFADILGQCSRMMQMIVALPQPVIAAVEGVATAAGCQLVASCDLAVAGAQARFCTPGVHIGLFCSTPMVALSRNVSHKHAMEMLLLGDMADAATAHRFGLVNRVTVAGGATEEAMAMARVIAGKSPLTVMTGKQAFYRQREMNLEEAYAYTSSVMLENMLRHDAEEGIGAFIEKRDPHWEGR
jgi:enoyl-CoA hydratase/carnithine racemase